MKYWLYHFIRLTVGIPYKTYFRSISIEGIDKIPKDKAVLICANHSGSFLDGVVMEYNFKEKVYTLVRGDAFNKPRFNRILRSMLLLPIYRSRDADPDKARKGNMSTWNESYELFKARNKILIFSEGIAYPEKKLRPLMKGSAGMAANMVNKSEGHMDLYVVACGINYSSFGQMRTELQLNFGQPIRVLDYLDAIQSDERQFVRDFTQKLETELSGLVVQTHGESENEKEFLHQMLRNEYGNASDFVLSNSGSEEIVHRLNGHKEELDPSIIEYQNLLKKHGISDRNLAKTGVNFFAILISICTAAMSIPAALVYRGFWALAKRRTKKMVKNIVLFDSVHFGLGLLFFYLWFVLIVMAAIFFLPEAWSPLWKSIGILAALIGTPACFIAVEEVRHLFKQIRFLLIPSKQKAKIQKLREQILTAL